MTTHPTRILLQTTILTLDDDWSIWRFSMLHDYLKSLTDEDGNPLCFVTARDREPDADGNDPILSQLDRAEFDQLWLFALDIGDGLSTADCAGIQRFYQQGGGIFTTRDHQDMGVSMCGLPVLSQFHYFHSQNVDPDPTRCCDDDVYTTYISWPNYHSGRNGDYQPISIVEPVHPLLRNPNAPGGVIALFPAHPHEGGVGVPEGVSNARVIATGKSLVSDRSFNLAVAAEPQSDGNGQTPGRIVAQSTFHHLVDYNWDIAMGCPSFVDEPPGNGMQTNPQALADIRAYVKNLVLWLSPTEEHSP